MANSWHTSPDALAIIVGIEQRPATEPVRDTLSDETQLCYVGPAVDALDKLFVNTSAWPIEVHPVDVLAALYGPADPARVHVGDREKWAGIAADIKAAFAEQEAAFAKFETARGAARRAA